MYIKKLVWNMIWLVGILFVISPITVKADTRENQYLVIDEAGFLSEEEEQGIITRMQENVPDGNAIVLISSDASNRSSEEDTIRYAKSQYTLFCGYTDGVIFVIDMSTRFIEIVTMENYVDKLSNYKAASICDGVYKYASKEDYYGCCVNAWKMIGAETGVATTKGKNDGNVPVVTAPKSMHVVTNILLALVIALILNFYFLKYLSKTPEANVEALAESADVNIKIKPGNHAKTGSEHVEHELGSLEGVIYTRNWFGKLIHLVCFIIIVAFRILVAYARGSGSSGSSSSGGHSGGGHSGGGGHRF
ncbi:MAG: TPM domain-containing protein [Eubacteriales bacterium]|nr:TPM domain-containing protein [Eubacteriales bacterium]